MREREKERYTGLLEAEFKISLFQAPSHGSSAYKKGEPSLFGR